jgi:Uma2 family endonuclease
MVELKIRGRTINLPFILNVQEVPERLFRQFVRDGVRGDFRDGEMFVVSPPERRQRATVEFFRRLLRAYVERRGLGAVLGPRPVVRLPNGAMVMPDVFFVAGRPPSQSLPQVLDCIPDLVVDFRRQWPLVQAGWRRRWAYEDAGVPEIWEVSLEERQITQHRKRRTRYGLLAQTGGTVTAQTVAGFRCKGDWLWKARPPALLRCLEHLVAPGRGASRERGK